jgi:hypothetical protein
VQISGVVPLGFLFRATFNGAQIGGPLEIDRFDRVIEEYAEEAEVHPYTEPNFPEIDPAINNP